MFLGGTERLHPEGAWTRLGDIATRVERPALDPLEDFYTLGNVPHGRRRVDRDDRARDRSDRVRPLCFRRGMVDPDEVPPCSWARYTVDSAFNALSRTFFVTWFSRPPERTRIPPCSFACASNRSARSFRSMIPPLTGLMVALSHRPVVSATAISFPIRPDHHIPVSSFRQFLLRLDPPRVEGPVLQRNSPDIQIYSQHT